MTICKANEQEEDEDTIADIHESQFRTSHSRRGFDSNQRTRNQFRPRNTTKGTTSYQLRQYAEATLGGGSLKKIVKLPEGEDENEWLAVNSTE
jgi:MOB kinase activator 1